MLHELALPSATALCSSYVLREDGLTPFPRMRCFSVAALYPHPWGPVDWEAWAGK